MDNFLASWAVFFKQTLPDLILNHLIIFIPNLIGASIIFISSYYFGKIFSKSISKLIAKTIGDDTLSAFFKNLIFIGIMILGTITALSNLGIQTTSIIAALGAAGLAIALSLKDSLSNLANGILLILLRYFKKGDSVRIGSIHGKVETINLFHTTITTFENQVVILPNSSVITNPIINYSANKTRRVDLVFGISYTSDIELAKSLLQTICANQASILKTPPPLIGVQELNASSVDLIVRYWVSIDDFFTSQIILRQQVKTAFDKAQIEIPYNKLDIHLNEPLKEVSK